jgi:hypothetical protein
MIKFFSKIRRNLLDGGKNGRYLKYAIGEIFLVMIGILLALQVNNWNEKRKSKKNECTLLTELHKSVKEDIKNITEIINRNQSYMSSAHIVLNAIENNQSFNDSISDHLQRSFKVWRIYIKTSAYDNLKEYGLHVIENERTRNSIISAYGGRAKFVDELYARYDQFRYNVVEPELVKSFKFEKTKDNDYGLFPLRNDLKTDHHKLRYLLIKSIDLQDQIIEAKQRTLNSFKDIQAGLNAEIKCLIE